MSSNESISSRHDLIRKYIGFVDDNVEYLTCAICGNILIDPCQAILCGCRFCLACLQELFRYGNEFCPGAYCKNERLSSMDEVHSDDETNSKIEKLTARCLVNGCRVEGPFRDMVEHVGECSKEWSISNLNDSVMPSTETPACLQERVDTIGKAMEGVKMNVDVILRQLSMADERMRLLDKKVKANEIQIVTHKDTVDELRKEINRKGDEILMLKKELKALKSQQGMKEFIWKIRSYSKRRRNGRSLKSEEFYTFEHGYKTNLLLYPNGDGRKSSYGTHMSLYCQLVPGEWDDILDWPFRHNLVLSLLDQSGNGRHEIVTITTDSSEFCQKPNKKPNGGYGRPYFVRIDQLSTDGFLKDDTLFISCRLEKKEDDT